MKKRRLLLYAGILLAALCGGVYLWLFWDLPAPDDLSAYAAAPSSKILDRYGRLLFEMPPPYTGSHTPVALEAIPDALIWATIATEDASFYANPGMDAAAILRAAWINLQGGEVLAGGSTITQQLVRTMLFEPEARYEITVRRKLRELALAVRLTRRYDKDTLLEFYLNEIYYGNMAYGVEAAAQGYYGKHVGDLDLAECALLAGLPQAPALYHPLENLEAAKARQQVVLDLMVKRGYITASDARLAHAEPLAFAAAPFPIRAPHFVMAVRAQLERDLGLERLQAGGLTITTTLDVALNETARDAMRHHLRLLAVCHYQAECPPGGHNARNAALLALDPQSGEVLAMVGSPDYFSQEIAGAVNGTLAPRQPGSALKPVTYAAAFTRGDFTPATMILDVRTAFVTREGAPYVPLNYDLVWRGPVRAREALASSYNLPAVKVLEAIGVDALTGLSRHLGITSLDDAERLGLAMTLGGGEVQLIQLTAAYAAFANGGDRVTPVLIRRVTDASGATLWAAPPGRGPRVLDARVAYLINNILSDDFARIPGFGEGSVLNLAGRAAAVKTGTTTNFRDNWTVGYTPELAVGVWVGNANNEPMQNVTGITGAAPIWRDVMQAALKGHPAQSFPRPAGLVAVEVCALSGQLPGPDCPHRVRETFIAGTEPTETCPVHQRVGGTVYTVLPPEAHTWAREHGIPQPPESAPDAPLMLVSPDRGAVYFIDPSTPRAAQRIRVTAEAGVALAEVTLWADDVLLARLGAPPYQALWQLDVGEHTFHARGVTREGHEVGSAPVTIEVRGD